MLLVLQVKGYVEVHLEQGPVLEVGGQPLGVVSSIAGQTRLSVSMLGTQVRLCCELFQFRNYEKYLCYTLGTWVRHLLQRL